MNIQVNISPQRFRSPALIKKNGRPHAIDRHTHIKQHIMGVLEVLELLHLALVGGGEAVERDEQRSDRVAEAHLVLQRAVLLHLHQRAPDGALEPLEHSGELPCAARRRRRRRRHCRTGLGRVRAAIEPLL